MTPTALFVKHTTLPGKRDQVRSVWEKHMASAIQGNPGHVAYFYCFDRSNPDSICAFQLYSGAAAAEDFLRNPHYTAYQQEVEPLLAGPPQLTMLEPIWSKIP